MTKSALILGGSMAGIQSALDLADSGFQVELVEASPFMDLGFEFPLPPHRVTTRMLEAARHPNIHIWTNTRINRIEGEPGDYHIELRQHPRYVDLEKCTACGECIEVCPVTVPGTDRKVIYLEGQPGCAAIDKLGKPPCANTCPGGIHVQGYVALIAQGRFQEAIDLIRAAIPFPGICGRVCTHPCEINCRRAEIDQPVAVRLLKRFVADWELAQGDRKPSSVPIQPDAPKVAVVGAGPGGMAVADQLARMGYPVTVFEKLPVIGGMMAVGIPEYRLPRKVIAREYQHIQNLGVEVRLNTSIGPEGEFTLDDLFAQGYRAVCLAVGAHKSQSLDIPGEKLPGVVHGIELLRNINLSQQLADPVYAEKVKLALKRGRSTRVAVLGGGNTAMDVSRSIRRLGVEDVRILYRRTRAEMPAMPEEIDDAEQEGVSLEFLVSPTRVLGDDVNGVTGLECIRMKLGEPDSSGRRRPVPIADSEFVMDIDLVVLAIGQSPDLNILGEESKIAVTRGERVNVADVSFMTSQPGVFAVGDAVTRDKMVVIEAIGMGKQAAAAMDDYLQGRLPHEIAVDAREIPIARREMSEAEQSPKPRIPVATLPQQERITSFAEVELGYTAEQAITEAGRCLACGPCSECLACVQVCKPGAILHEQQETFTGLAIGAIIHAGDTPFQWPVPADGSGFYKVSPDDLIGASAAASRAMFDLVSERRLRSIPTSIGAALQPARIGVFVCECGGEISNVVDTRLIAERAAVWLDVCYTQSLPFSCTPEAADTIEQAIESHDLNRVVLAACSCCAIDQVCFSCTYQRVRCKENLGLFKSSLGMQTAKFEFVNLREQCAWIHANDPQRAAHKATGLVAGAVANVRKMIPKPESRRRVEKSVLVVGSGQAAGICQDELARQGVHTFHVDGIPARIQRADGQYVVTVDDVFFRASALILAPAGEQETRHLLDAFGVNGQRPHVLPDWGGLETHRPGIYFCDPERDPIQAGRAVAGRIFAWLSRMESRKPAVSVVREDRCRACGTCGEICEFGAPVLIEEGDRRYTWIDPSICNGCGTCAARCPSGAIIGAYSRDAQLEAALTDILR